MFALKGNENYAATVVRVKHLVELDGLDNLVALNALGITALVPKSTQIDDLLVLFPAETQLSADFVKRNNLFRDNLLNQDTEQSGYIEKNRRVKALKLRGYVSTGLALPVATLGTKVAPDEGTFFDHIKDEELCRKYVIKTVEQRTGKQEPKKRWVDPKQFPEHFSTAQLMRNLDALKEHDIVSVTQKLHGTSVRYGWALVEPEPKFWQRLLRIKPARKYEFVVGSRKVVKTDPKVKHTHYYGQDVWSRYGQQVKDLIPHGYVVYGELVGWLDETTPIQPNYTYDLAPGRIELYVYRVAVINDQGVSVDLSFPAVQEFCKLRGLKSVPEFRVYEWDSYSTADGLARQFMDNVYARHSAIAVPLSDPKTVDEGVCVRREGITPLVLKLKSPKFLLHETALLDQGVEA